MNTVDPGGLQNALGTFLTGIIVVTTHDRDGGPLRFRASSFTPVSLESPLILVCLANNAGHRDAFAQASGFAVNILAAAQKDIAAAFARPLADRFPDVRWKPGPYGAPIFKDAPAWFDCSLCNTVKTGDHLILIGKVEGFESSPARGLYPGPVTETAGRANSLLVSVLIEYQGKLLLIDDGKGRVTLPETEAGKEGVTRALKRLIAEIGASATPGFVYSVYENKERQTQHIAFLCQADDTRVTHGVFTELSETTLANVADPAICLMLERFSAESRLGNFGFYLGDHINGDVQPVRKMAMHDPLTSLYTRGYMNEHIEGLMARHKRDMDKYLSVIFLDIDYFKKINDSYGHACGDQVLAKAGGVIKEKSRPDDLCIRYGGDEFVVIMLSQDKDSALHLAERIRSDIRAITFSHNNVDFRITLSAGITLREDFESFKTTLHRADQNLYKAKANGRNCVVIA